MNSERTAANAGRFPRLDVRHFAGMYSSNQIRFVADKQHKPANSNLTVVFETPFLNGRLTDECKKFLLNFAVNESIRSGLHMCLVYDDDDSIFIEPDGRTSRVYWPSIKREQELAKEHREWKETLESWVSIPTLDRVESNWILPHFISPKLGANMERGLNKWNQQKVSVKEYTDLFQRAVNSGLLVELDSKSRRFGLHLINLRRCTVPLSSN